MSKNLNYPQATYFTAGVQTDVGYLINAASQPTNTASYMIHRIGTDLYWWNGTSSTQLTSTGGGSGVAGSLDSAYSIGTDITIDEGAITLTDATAGALNTLELVKSGAGSGNVLDIAIDAALTGNVIDIDMNLGLGAKAIYIDGGNGIRTSDIIDIKHDGSGNADVFSVVATNTGNGAIFDINMDGDGSAAGVFNVDMNLAVGAEFISLDAGGQTRTASLIEVKNDGAGNVDFLSITDTNTGSGYVFDIAMNGIGAGAVFNVDMHAAVGEEFMILDAGGGARTANLFEFTNDGSGNVDLFSIVDSNTGSGALFDINMDGNGGGSVFDVDMNAALGEEFMILDAGNKARTANLFEITLDGSGNVDLFSIASSDTGSGSVFDIDCTGATGTGAVIDVDLDTAVARPFLTLDYGNGTRTEDVCQVTFDGDGATPFWDINITNTGAGGTSDYWDIAVDAVYTGSILQVVYGTAAATGDTISLDMGTAVGASALSIACAGARTDDLIKIDDASTSNSPMFDINFTGAHTGGCFDIHFDHANQTGAVMNIDMDGALGATAIEIDYGNGTRTEDLILVKMDGDGNTGVLDVTVTNTGSGNIIELDIDSVHTGNAFLVNYGTDAATGDCISLTMGTNVAGRAIMISSAATGASGEGAAIDITHTGDLAAGADVINITSSGNISSTSNLLALEQATGAGTTGANCLYINATGTNVEAIKVDAGNVVFDENLTVTGTSVFTGAMSCTAGVQSASVARTATNDGLTTGIIAAGSKFVTVTSAGANNIIALPAAVVGNEIWLYNAATGYELRTKAGDNETINAVDSDGTNELAITATYLVRCNCVAAGKWIAVAWDADGADIAALVPDAA